ncbi:tyrosine-protein kinase Srms [Rhinophrynus dorsalis]
MESFLKEQLSCLRCLWDKIWPQVEINDPPTVETVSPIPNNDFPHRADIVTVLYNFGARSTDELSVEQGEQLCKIRDEGDFVMARKLKGGMEVGLVPSTYVIQSNATTSPKPTAMQEPWYLEVASRYEAERLLLSPPNTHGSFLVRPSDSNTGLYSLSVRSEDKVTHFRIQKNSKGQFYLQSGHSFQTIQELINFHKINWKMIKCPLLQPCVQQVIQQGDSWERPREEFRLIRKLGEGFFGEVWEGTWNNKERVAIKTFKQENIIMSDLEKEIDALKVLCHRNLIQLLAICSIGEPVYIVTELMTKGNLQCYLSGLEGKRLKSAEFMHIICQVADGMAYLENKHVIHRDLAARNILVGENLICKIADFGLARLLKDDLYSPENNKCIPIKWTAPEALSYRKFSSKSDVWSFGILIYEVYTFGQQPYKGMNNKEVLDNVIKGYRLPAPQLCSQDMYSLMLQCWKDKAQERPSFQELVEKLTMIQRSIK